MRKSHNIDMTTGNPIRLMILFSLPLLLGNLFQQLYSLVDTMVAGYNLGDSAIAAIGAVTALDTTIINLAMGLNQGFAIILTIAVGAHDNSKIRRSIATMIRFNINTAVLLTIFSCALLGPILRLLKTPQDIFNQAYQYAFIICAGITTTIAYNTFSSILRSFGNSLMSLVFLIFSSILNIILDVLFVAVFGMGIQGAAIATVIAAAISAVLSGIYFVRNYKEFLPKKADFAKDKQISRDMISSGFGMSMMYTSVNIGTIIFQGAINSLGTLYLTAHTASRKLMLMLMAPGSSFCSALATFISQNWGARRKDRIRATIWKALLTLEGMSTAIMIFAFTCGSFIVRLMTGSSDSQMLHYAALSINLNVAFFPALQVLLIIRHSLQAMGHPKAAVVAAILEMLCKVLFTAFIVPVFGFVAVCLTEPASWVICAVYITIFFATKRKALLSDDD